ncbi:MAG TPA: class I SAM-dependent methyltransferase [Candidatus Kryptobacter bacterium]|nr:class I SAM-dependent methyltransferase [Candidatus Kryptobacter bacterium]
MNDYLNSHYDLESEDVISVIDELSLWSAPFGLRLLDTIHYTCGIKALDIGSGPGFPLVELAMRLGGTSEVFGIDPWKAGIERTKRKIETYGLTNAKVVKGRSEHLPFTNGFFDLIVSNNGINNVGDINKTLSETSRVAKTGAQFVFTFNTDQTFIQFYRIYRETLSELGFPEYNKQLLDHIFEKRKPVAFMEQLLTKYGFSVNSTRDDLFHYVFTDGTAMLNHFFIKLAFLNPWRNIVPPVHREKVFRNIERKLNDQSREFGELRMQVPFVTFDCERDATAPVV